MLSNTSPRTSLALFCKVVDNYGDIGICWRLARQLCHEHGIDVTLWVDDLRSFRRLCPDVVVDADLQQLSGVTVRYWRDQDGVFSSEDIADIVIEFFGCDIPPGYIETMVRRNPKPLWFNLEGLTAEDWVEGCHMLPSSHPRLPLTKHFFFPGFTARTGGLLHEAGLEAERLRFQSDAGQLAAFLRQLGLADAEIASTKASLFCYPHAPVAALFDAWRQGDKPVVCLVPESVATEAVSAFIGHPSVAGAAGSRDALTVRVLPFIPQPDYDRLLWACDLNFVRGEDSFVRAQWAARPFVWHIYPQDENLHHKKLRAFLQRYSAGTEAWAEFSLAWNGAGGGGAVPDWMASWRSLYSDLPELTRSSEEWGAQMLAQGDFTSRLLAFAATLRPGTDVDRV